MIRTLLSTAAISLTLVAPAYATSTYECTAEGIDARSPALSVVFNVGAMSTLTSKKISVTLNGRTTALDVTNYWLDADLTLIRSIDSNASRNVFLLKYDARTGSGSIYYEKAIPSGSRTAPDFPVMCEEIG